MMARSVTRSMRPTWSISALARDCSRNHRSSPCRLGMMRSLAARQPGVNVGATAAALPHRLGLGPGFQEELAVAINEAKAFGRIQRFEQGADDAGVGKRIARAAVDDRASAWTKARRQTRSSWLLLLARVDGIYPIGFPPPPLFRQEQTQPHAKRATLSSRLMERLDGQPPTACDAAPRCREAPDEQPHGQAGAPAARHGDARGLPHRGWPRAGAGPGRVPRQDRVRFARSRHARLDERRQVLRCPDQARRR